MKLYLSSYKFGNHPEKLAELAGSNKKVAVIMNAVDFGDKERQHNSLLAQIEKLNELGFEARGLDLRNYFGKKDELREYLKGIGMVWIHGGNTFILKRAFEQSGFEILIKEFVINDQIIYAGFSAAVCVATPTLRGAELVDNPNVVPEGYIPNFSWNGLGLIPYNVAVHYQSNHPESELVEKEVEYFKEKSMPYKTLQDGEVIVVENMSPAP
ncbi:MAG: Type 1 glutamine amidotransferase-like domain-containing protein [Candidatus Paceibacterota bacterium]|jgi:dipeptidase E